MLAKYGDGTADLEDGDEDGGPACGGGKKEQKVVGGRKKVNIMAKSRRR